MKQQKICSIIQDILFIQQEHKISEESKAIIEEHLKACQACKKIRDSINNKIEDEIHIKETNEVEDEDCGQEIQAKEQCNNDKFKEIAYKLRKRRRKNRILVTLVCAVLIVTTNLAFENYKLPFESMEPTIKVGEYCFINKLAYSWSSPMNNDIVYLSMRQNGETWNDIYRVIGVPGDTIQIKEGKVYVNGSALEADYLTGIKEGGIATQEIKVPEGKYFIMGDQVNNAYDSRYFGCIDETSIQGKLWFTW
ncbi:signal peptidase I [Sporanaerobium hydrogeniformans]|uniref:Signal peptidase I n=1 Tax=Sporanaerobium hydrogeniformans TaxID=3072179 RepID=A0AC61D9S0_9FIRM|nr:signal peptidase I [Sporanaerobium hydrogeniformans]PHV69491.1 signal peptidase I [Sporanaerobium hydrogeniformans]